MNFSDFQNRKLHHVFCDYSRGFEASNTKKRKLATTHIKTKINDQNLKKLWAELALSFISKSD